VTPRHGVLATHRGAKDHRQFQHDNPFPLTLVFNESDYEYVRPVYYGRYGDFVWIVMFRNEIWYDSLNRRLGAGKEIRPGIFSGS
jgi:hypothetical protein